MEPVTQRFDGFLLTFSPAEFTKIRRRLEARGYAADCDGLKKLVLDIVEREEGPEYRIGGMIGDFVEKNPALVMAGMSMGAQVVGRVMRGVERMKKGR